MTLRNFSGALLAGTVGLFALGSLPACSHEQRPLQPASANSAEQGIVNEATTALQGMRHNSQFGALDSYLRDAKAVLIFPSLVKASFVFGGEGGNGVLVARTAGGGWSAPAFYSIGGPSIGLQAGYKEATVVLVFLEQRALLSALDHGITLGSDVTFAAGTVGDTGESSRAGTSKDIVYFAEARGVFAGVSLDGAFIGARQRHNEAYYGAGATPRSILVDGKFDSRGAAELKNALVVR
jgi:lipid-binding SYLF domain-containing protein